MHAETSSALVARLSSVLGERLGIHFPEKRHRDLQNAMERAARELGFPDTASCIRRFLAPSLPRGELEILASHLTVGETYFFREPKAFEVLEHRILPELICARRASTRHIRIWSAGCATGEEPYSLAMLLHGLLPDLDDWNIRILATDINPRFLERAEEGVYRAWSFRGTPQWIKDRYFTPVERDRLRIRPEIQRHVSFAYHNLVEDPYPALSNGTAAMDLIFCRNVLMYFEPAHLRRVVRALGHCLVPGGWLLVGSVEASHSLFSDFSRVNFDGVSFYARDLPEGQADTRPGGSTPAMHPTTESEPSPGDDAAPTDVPAAPESSAPPAGMPADGDPGAQAIALIRQGRYGEAALLARTLLGHEPGAVRGMQLLARALANEGELEEAAEWCMRAIAAEKLDARSHYLLASIHSERGQDEEAVNALRRAIYLEPGLVLAHFSLGNIARMNGDRKAYRRHFSNALALLEQYSAADVLEESEGMSAGRLREAIAAALGRAEAA